MGKEIMNTQISIHDNDTANTGTYKVWYEDEGKQKCCTISEQYVNSLLSMGQKEDFFMGKYKFRINESDFIKVILQGKEIGGLGEIKRTQLLPEEQPQIKEKKLKTHQVLDLHYTEDECQGCFVGTLKECEDFTATQTPHFMYKVVPMTKEEIESYPDNLDKEVKELEDDLYNSNTGTPPVNTKPLYKVLNEQRIKGVFKNFSIASNINHPFRLVLEDDPYNTCICEFKMSELRDFKEVMRTGEYTALAVNNLHILSEALIECISLIERMSVMLKVQPTKFSEYNEAKEALSKIS